MKWIDDIKEQIPVEQLQLLISQIKSNIAAKTAKKEDPVLKEVETILKRIHFLLSEKPVIDLGKQEIFTRVVPAEDGKTQTYTYIVDFNRPAEVKRLRTVLLELADLSSPDAQKAKRESIPGYLDYIAQTSI